MMAVRSLTFSLARMFFTWTLAVCSDTVITFNNSFVPGGAWLTPTRIAPARYAKIGGQFDF